jgi:FtsZ-binding cell division protein ZapB
VNLAREAGLTFYFLEGYNIGVFVFEIGTIKIVDLMINPMNVENVNIETLNKKIEDLSNTIRNLRHANLLYQKVLDKLPLGLNLSDGNGNPLIVNQIYQSIKENYFINDSNIQSLQNDYYVQSSTNILNQRVDDENSYEHEFTIYPKTNTLNQLSDNETRVIDEIVTSMQMPGVKNNYQLSVLFDVTEIKEKNNLINAQIKDYQLINQKLEKAFDKVKKSEAQFRMLIEKAPAQYLFSSNKNSST